MSIISALRLKVGPEAASPLHLPLTPSITILVGPNNSGKSHLLREIDRYCRGEAASGNLLLDRLAFHPTDERTARLDLERMTRPGWTQDLSRPEYRSVGTMNDYNEVSEKDYLRARLDPDSYHGHFGRTYGQYICRHLDGARRLTLLNPASIGDLKAPSGLLPRLLSDDPRRTLVRKRIFDQLGLYLALDITGLPHVRARLGTSPPPNERSLEESTVEYMRRATDIDRFSDGVRAFCGLIAQVHVGAPRIITIDEPEAFLAPPLAHALGKELADAALTEGKQIFVATHSSHFLMGAVAAGAAINIIRLTYDEGETGTARLLPSSDLKGLMNDPMLRSANVLSALFYKGAVVGEADADRAFYQECNERLLAKRDPRGTTDVIFLNANGKDVVPKIVEPLRRLGIPAASVLDLDAVKKGGSVWTRHLAACGLPALDHATLGQRRANLLQALTNAKPNWKTNGGVSILDAPAIASAQTLLDELDRHGMFLVRGGEVETWLAHLNVPRSKDLWLHSIFEAMGSDPSHSSYEQPGRGGVWDFIGKIGRWLRDRSRHGMP
jgi:predicted ATPase